MSTHVKEVGDLLAAFSSLAFLTLLSRVSGFFRVALFAAFYGGTREADLFLAVMILPELLYRLISEGLVSSAAIPIFVQKSDAAEEAASSCRTLFWGVSLVGLLLVVILEVFAPAICGFIVPGFPVLIKSRMILLWRVITPYLLFALQSAVLTSFLNARDRFASPAIGPILVNVAIIIGIFFQSGGAVDRIGWAVTLGGLLQVVWLAFLVSQIGFGIFHRTQGKPFFHVPFLWEFFRSVAPVAGWLIFIPFIPVYERYLLSSQPIGSVAILSYTEKIMNLPLGIIAISLARVAFPFLSRGNIEERNKIFGQAIWGAVCLLVPFILVLHAGAEEVVTIVLRRGKFQAAEVQVTTQLLQAFCWSLFPVSVVMVVNRMFFAQRRNYFPLFIGLCVIAMHFILNTLLVEHLGAVGVGWGACGAALFHAFLGMYFLSRRGGGALPNDSSGISFQVPTSDGWYPLITGVLFLGFLAVPVRWLCRFSFQQMSQPQMGVKLAFLFGCWVLLQTAFWVMLGRRRIKGNDKADVARGTFLKSTD